jgi:hypothetical protein
MNKRGKHDRVKGLSRMTALPLLLLALIALTGPAFASDQTWHCMKAGEIGKHAVRAGDLILSGIEIDEQPGELAHLPVIRVSFTARNKASKDFHVAMEIIGSNDKGPVFAMSVEPGFAGTVSPKSDQPATTTIFAAPGELAKATNLCVRFVGDF